MTTREIHQITPEELREKHGLEVYDNISQLTGEHPERTVVKEQSLAESLGVKRGQAVAMPPVNPNPVDTEIIRELKNGRVNWIRRVEGPHWQADLFIQAEYNELGEPIYELFDRLGEVMPQMKAAAENTSPWREIHDTAKKTMDRVLSNTRQEPPHGLHQRYG